jgi:hypothetical protein
MRRVSLLITAAGLLALAMPVAGVEAAGGSLRWTAVELSMVPRSDGLSPAWTVRLQADGAGMYSERASADARPVPLTVSAATLERVRMGEHAAKSGKCETKAKNIAKSGEKTIRYEAAERTEECTFNYSDDAGLMGAAATFQAIAETMQRGERLEHDLRYDRLGLDAEMEALVAAKENGSAIEIGNIAPVLQALVSDDHVIDRVRRRAARLLQDVGAPVPAGYEPSER